ERKNLRVKVRCTLVINARRSTRKDDPFRLQRGNIRRRDVETNNLRIDLALTNPPRNDLGILRTEIEDENFAMSGRRDSLHGLRVLRVWFGRFEVRIVGTIHRAESSMPGYPALELF